MTPNFHFLGGLALLFAAAGIPALAADAEKPMAVRTVMQQLGSNMQAVTGAIALEDWALVAQLAERIADHPEPPLLEKARVFAWLGTDVLKFRGLDGKVHEAAMSLHDVAKQGDGEGVINAFAKVQQSCLACHQSYRQSFRQHFYGTP